MLLASSHAQYLLEHNHPYSSAEQSTSVDRGTDLHVKCGSSRRSADVIENQPGVPAEVECQTDCSLLDLEARVSFLERENAALRKELKSAKFSVEIIKDNDDLTCFYTGLPRYLLFTGLVRYLSRKAENLTQWNWGQTVVTPSAGGRRGARP